MTDKEKLSSLVEMGFTIEESISLVKGNYRTVPDPDPAPAKDPDPAPVKDPDPAPAKEPDPAPAKDPDPAGTSAEWNRIETALARLTEAMVTNNINNRQQPEPMQAKDLLGLMLEPEKPGERK